MVDNPLNEGAKRRKVLRSLGVLGTGVGGSAFMTNSATATQTDRVSPQSSDDRIDEIWDEIVDMVADFVSGPIPLSNDHPQLDAEERQKTIEALESFDYDDLDEKPENNSNKRDNQVEIQSGMPSKFPVDVCFDMVYSKLCLDSGYPQFGKPDCSLWVPELWYYSFSVNQLSRGLDGNFSIDITAENLWLGVEDDGCVWAGEETSETCARLDCRSNKIDYMNDPVSEVAESALGLALEAGKDVLDELNDKFSGWQYYVAIALIALCLVILAIKIIPVSFFVGAVGISAATVA